MSQGQQDRRWTVERGVYEDGTPEAPEDFRARVRAKLIDCEAAGDLIGGAFYCRPMRAELAPGVWETISWSIMWTTEGAARRAMGEFDRKPEPQHFTPRVIPEDDPEPVAVGAPEDEDGDS